MRTLWSYAFFGVDIAINVKLHVNHSWSSSPLISLQPFSVDGPFATLVYTPLQQVCSNGFCSRTQFQFNGNNIVSFVSAWKIVYAHATEEMPHGWPSFDPVCRVLFSQNFKPNESQWFNNFDKLMTSRRLTVFGYAVVVRWTRGDAADNESEWKTTSSGIQPIFKWHTRLREHTNNLNPFENGQLSLVQRNLDFLSNQFSARVCFVGTIVNGGSNYHE